MANYDNDVLGVSNVNHPANQTELSDREMLTEVYNVPKEVLEIFDRVEDDLNSYRKIHHELVTHRVFLHQIKETLSASDNGHCIIVRNQIENFLKG